ncbi:MAG: hypothetical protein OHK0015_03650 [Chloroflexi bacterium OHK40]
MAKKARPGTQPNPALRLSNLGPRLARLLANPASDPQTIRAELDLMIEGLKPLSYLPIVISTFAALPEAQREPLDTMLSTWIQERGLLPVLHNLEDRRTFQEPARSLARQLLEAGGHSLAAEEPINLADLFLAAYELGEASQDAPTIFWHEDERRRRVCSASFLIDFEPPWEGAVKDLAFDTYRNFDQARERFFSLWQARGLAPRAISASTAAQRVWRALRQNQSQAIRLPIDLIAAIPQVLPFLLALPLPPDVEPLTLDEIEALATTGRSPESIRTEERMLGYQTRMPDGSVIRIMRPPDDDDL